MKAENLCRADLTPAQAAQQTARRKELYEMLHPETANGSNQHTRVRQIGEPSDRFTADTAERTGRPERSIQRDAARGKALGDDLGRIAGGSPDASLPAALLHHRRDIRDRGPTGDLQSEGVPTRTAIPG